MLSTLPGAAGHDLTATNAAHYGSFCFYILSDKKLEKTF